MKVSELLIKAKELWMMQGRGHPAIGYHGVTLSFHEALSKVTDDPTLRSDAHMYLGAAYFTEEEKIDRAIGLAERTEAERAGDPPEGPETW